MRFKAGPHPLQGISASRSKPLRPNTKACQQHPVSSVQRHIPGEKSSVSQQGRFQASADRLSTSGTQNGSSAGAWQDLEGAHDPKAGVHRERQERGSSQRHPERRKSRTKDRRATSSIEPCNSGSSAQPLRSRNQGNLAEPSIAESEDLTTRNASARLQAWNECAGSESAQASMPLQAAGQPGTAQQDDSGMWAGFGPDSAPHPHADESPPGQGTQILSEDEGVHFSRRREAYQGQDGPFYETMDQPHLQQQEQHVDDASRLAEQCLEGVEEPGAGRDTVQTDLGGESGSTAEIGPRNGVRDEVEAFLHTLDASPQDASALWERSLDVQGLLPQVLRRSPLGSHSSVEEELGYLCSVLVMFKVKRDEIVSCLTAFPPVLQCDPQRLRNEASDLRRRYDISTAAVGCLLKHNPGILCHQGLSQTMHGMMGFLRRVGLQPNALCEVAAVCPEAFVSVQLEEAVKVTKFLRHLYLDQGRVIKTVIAQPQLLLTGGQRPYEAICREFFQLGVPEHVVRGMVSRYPLMLGKPTLSFKPLFRIFEAANIKGMDLQEMLVEYPQVLYRDLDDTKLKMELLKQYVPNPGPRLKLGPSHFFPKATIFTVGPRFAFVTEHAPQLRDTVRISQLLNMEETELASKAGVDVEAFLAFKDAWVNEHWQQ
eukprot:jgi/Botrbrau1/16410/Bobra.0142s0010.1